MPKYHIDVKGVTVTQDEFEETYQNIEAASMEAAHEAARSLAYKDGALNINIVATQELNEDTISWTTNMSSTFHPDMFPGAMVIVGPFPYGSHFDDNEYDKIQYKSYTDHIAEHIDCDLTRDNKLEANNNKDYNPYMKPKKDK